MGEFILREEGFEVVSVTDGTTALVRLPDVDPDLVLADVSLPGKSGYELCSHIKRHAGCRHVRVVLTAGAMEAIDEAQAGEAGADGVLRKPFEASVMVETVRRLVKEAEEARLSPPEPAPVPTLPAVEEPPPAPEPVAALEDTPPAAPTEPKVVETVVEAPPLPPAMPKVDAECVRASVTLALEAALPVLIDEVTQRVLEALEAEGKAAGA